MRYSSAQADQSPEPLQCCYCGKQSFVQMQRCSRCQAVKYCSKSCQKEHYAEHKVLCHAIKTMEDRQAKNLDENCLFQSHLTPKQKARLVGLVGEKCEVKCSIGGQSVNALWDTGAQVSLIDKNWLDSNKIPYELKQLSELMNLQIKTADGKLLPYVGYTTVNTYIGSELIEIPFLVTKQRIAQPIIGFNVISSLIQTAESMDKKLVSNLSKFFPKKVSVESVVSVIEEATSSTFSPVRIPKSGVKIRANSSSIVDCKINNIVLETRTPAVFEPSFDIPEELEIQEELIRLKKGPQSRVRLRITNNSNRQVMVPGRLHLGSIQLVSSVIPIEVDFKEHTFTQESPTEQTSDLPDIPEDCDEIFMRYIDKQNLGNLTAHEKNEVRKLLYEHREVFAISDSDAGGEAKDLVMNIDTTDEIPVQKNYTNIPRPLYEDVKTHIADLIHRGWITKSKSAWSSPIVLARKKGGGIRVCCDFRALNKKTVTDRHPIPRIQTSLENLGGCKWFTILDLTRAYHQGYIHPDSRDKTAFITPWGLYQWTRIPFGLKNAPAVFQRYMEDTLHDFRDEFAMPYLDDIIVYSTDLHSHLQHLGKVLNRVKEKGLKLKLQKCKFFAREVKYLGRIVNENGYRMDEDSIEAVRILKNIKPTTVAEVRQVLGLVGYHRRHIQDFATIAKPLTDLLKGSNNNGKLPVEWSEEHSKSLNQLIDFTTSSPILAYPNYDDEFYIHTDASQKGLGCILYQVQDGKKRVIAYGSRTLLPAEKNYHSTKLEFLALKWAICEKFRDFVAYADHFTVYTDNNPLLYIMSNTKLNANGQRWVSELSEFNFTIKYRPGIINRDADCLSRLPLDISKYQELCSEEVATDVFQAVASAVEVQSNNDEVWVSAIAANNTDEKFEDSEKMISIDELKDAQRNDVDIARVIYLLESNEKVSKDDSKVTKNLLREKNKLFVDDGLLKRKSGQFPEQIVWPKALKDIIYEHLHINMGHLMTDRVYQLARQRVYWPKMYSDIDEFVHNRCQCIVNRKPNRDVHAPLQSIHTASPMELVAIDYLHLETSSRGHEYVLLIVDHFTRFAQAYPTKNKSALTAAKHLYGDFILRFGVPTRIMHDQGREFENKLFDELEKLSGVTKSRTTPYHPQTNGACERMNRTLLQMMRTLEEKEKVRWHEKLNKLTFAYNCTRHETTGYSPHFLMFGREPSIFLDRLIGKESQTERKTHDKYVNDWKNQMQEAYEIAFQRASKKKAADRRRQLEKPCLTPLQRGDRVLLKNVKERGGPGKLRSYWERRVYRIEDSQGPVYTVVDEKNITAKPRVVHRNMIMLVDNEFVLDSSEKKRKPKKQQQHARRTPVRKEVPVHDEEERHAESDDERPLQLVQYHNEVMDDDHHVQNENVDNEMVPDELVIPPEDETVDDENVATPNESSGEEDQIEQLPERRQRRPRRIFTYDVPGEPSIYAMSATQPTLHTTPMQPVCNEFRYWSQPTLPTQPYYGYQQTLPVHQPYSFQPTYPAFHHGTQTSNGIPFTYYYGYHQPSYMYNSY